MDDATSYKYCHLYMCITSSIYVNPQRYFRQGFEGHPVSSQDSSAFRPNQGDFERWNCPNRTARLWQSLVVLFGQSQRPPMSLPWVGFSVPPTSFKIVSDMAILNSRQLLGNMMINAGFFWTYLCAQFLFYMFLPSVSPVICWLMGANMFFNVHTVSPILVQPYWKWWTWILVSCKRCLFVP